MHTEAYPNPERESYLKDFTGKPSQGVPQTRPPSGSEGFWTAAFQGKFKHADSYDEALPEPQKYVE